MLGEGGEDGVVVVAVELSEDVVSSGTSWSASLGLKEGLPGVTAARGVNGVVEPEASEASRASGVGRVG